MKSDLSGHFTKAIAECICFCCSLSACQGVCKATMAQENKENPYMYIVATSSANLTQQISRQTYYYNPCACHCDYVKYINPYAHATLHCHNRQQNSCHLLVIVKTVKIEDFKCQCIPQNRTITNTLTSLTLSGPLYVATTAFCRVSYIFIKLPLTLLYTIKQTTHKCIHSVIL